MVWIASLFLALPLMTDPPAELPREENEFGYYYGEFMTYAMEDSQPMARLITDRLADSVFHVDSNQELQDRIQTLKTASQDNPELMKRFTVLDEKMKKSLNTRVSKGQQKRLIYTAAGAILGAVIAIPVGSAIAAHSTLGMKVLWIAIPAGALVGAGAGWLLEDLLKMPTQSREKDFLSKDLEMIRTEMNQ